MSKRKIISIILALVIVFASVPTASYSLQAKTKVSVLSSKKIAVTKGKTKTVKLKNATKKVKWKVVSGRKNVKIVKKTGKYQNKIKLKARKKGNAVLVAVHGKKIYTLKVMIKDKGIVVPETIEKPKEEPTTKEEETTENLKPEYATVTFLGFDGEVACTMEYEKGKPYQAFPSVYSVYKEGYSFLGWSEEKNGKAISRTAICERDVTLWAQYGKVGNLVEATYEIVEK